MFAYPIAVESLVTDFAVAVAVAACEIAKERIGDFLVEAFAL